MWNVEGILFLVPIVCSRYDWNIESTERQLAVLLTPLILLPLSIEDDDDNDDDAEVFCVSVSLLTINNKWSSNDGRSFSINRR